MKIPNTRNPAVQVYGIYIKKITIKAAEIILTV